ncbi:uncharacterized protein LOC107268913 [Cephus cinctus]|uniref:Uncharacterized protein LOC107268913 n=1 Tax=Cephus cinctus TaxID=211228 RepID=A0AAJ7BYU2_CEPCN|nr:uncharacterized protein LOC107268913 [Cephus cinctus]
MIREYYGRIALSVLVFLGSSVAAQSSSASASTSSSPSAATSNATNTDYWDDDDFIPYQGERFNVFDWNLCKSMAKKFSGNMLISPISVKLALVLLYEGAQDQTAHELAGAMQLPVGRFATRDTFSNILQSLQATRPEYVLNVGTRLYVDSSIVTRQRYGAILKTFYNTDLVSANLSDTKPTAAAVNDWVRNITNGNIPKVIEDHNSLKDSVMLVMNALYFKGSWRHPFPLNRTQVANFYTGIDKSVSTPFMHTVGNFYFSESPELDAKIIRLPYLGHKYAMFLILPRTRDGIEHLVREINPFILTRHMWLMQDVPVDVTIPKFKFDFTSHLENILRELGIRDIFDNTATLTGIAKSKSTSKKLVVSDVLQKVGVEVNELGTAAYAATEIQVVNKFGEQSFHANHPFLFFIEDETTGTIVFVGKVTNPLEMNGHLDVSAPNLPNRFGDSTSGSQGVTSAEERYNFFNIELIQTVNNEAEGNVVISPASVKVALTTLVEGSGGRTRDELLAALRLPSDVVSIRDVASRTLAPFQNVRAGTELNLATRLWTNQDSFVFREYSDTLQKHYGGDLRALNFGDSVGSVEIINDWVRQGTKGHVNSIVESGSLDPDTKLLLTNALYFRGYWLKSFDKQATRLRCFNVPGRGCQETSMMENLSKYRYAYVPSLDAEIVEIPYADGRLAMLLMLPHRERGNLQTLSKDLSYTPISVLLDGLQETELLLSIPKFTIESKMDLKPALEKLGINDLFDLNANLSGIMKSPIRVGNVLHNAKIEVNEEGTIAAAVTGISVVPLMGSTVQNFRADRPFLFTLVDLETAGIIFAGRVVHPQINKASILDSDPIIQQVFGSSNRKVPNLLHRPS